MDIERALITKLCETGDMPSVQKERFTADEFIEPVMVEVYKWVDNCYVATGEIPSLDMLQSEFPDFSPEVVPDAIPLLVSRLREKRLYGELIIASRKAREKAKENPLEALTFLQEETARLFGKYSEDEGDEVDMAEAASSVVDRYERNKATRGLLGHPFLWDSLNRMTKGARNGHHMGLYGDSGSLKTWLLVVLAVHFFGLGLRVLFFTKETPVEDLMARAAAVLSEVNYEAWQDGTLDDDAEVRFYDAMESLKEAEDAPRIIEIMGMGVHALAEIRGKVRTHKPQIVIIDNLYYYAENLEWQNFGVLCNGVRQMARKEKMFFLTSNQANNESSKTKSGGSPFKDVGYGKVYAQSCTELVRIIREPINVDNDELVLVVKKVSEGKPGRFAINAEVAANFSEKPMTFNNDEGTGGNPARAGIDDADIT